MSSTEAYQKAKGIINREMKAAAKSGEMAKESEMAMKIIIGSWL